MDILAVKLGSKLSNKGTGSLSDLATTDKSSVVSAINELANDKQDKLVAGNGIVIDADGKTISSTGGGSGGSGDIIQDPNDPSGGMVVDGPPTVVDKTLTLSGYAADAKAVGEELSLIRDTKMSYVVTHTGTADGATAILDADNNVLSFNQLKAIYQAEDTFLYVVSDNIIHIPAYLETHALAFAGTYIIRGEDHIRRVIINDENVVQVNDHMLELADYKAVDMTVEDWESLDWTDTDLLKCYPDLKSMYNLCWPMKEELTSLRDDVNNLKGRVKHLEDMTGVLRYGVTGIGIASATLTRTHDAVGMTAQVGTDGDNSGVVNDFDNVYPFNRRKCVGEWYMRGGKAMFRVNAYYGDPDFAEDGSMGDYVAVDCTPAYYAFDQENGALVISAHQYDGYRPFDCLIDKETGRCRPHTYLPCYALAMKDGHAVSLPGFDNEQGDYAGLFSKCKTANSDANAKAILMPESVNFYDWAMFTVEFATQNCQSIMSGCSGLRHNNDDHIIMSDATHGIIQNYQAARVVGEYVSIQELTQDSNIVSLKASHKIVSIERCNADGTANASGTYHKVELEVLDSSREIVVGTEYRFVARPYRTGECNSVSTPSGSPVSNTNGYYPMKYRWRENVYGNQYQTTCDMMNFVVLEDGFANVNAANAAHLEWYTHRNPETLTPKNYANSAAGRDDIIANGWELIGETPAENYANGYIKSRVHSEKYPDLWFPGETTGASASTYYADYAYLVSSFLLRSLRLGGSWPAGSYAGFSYAYAFSAPSDGSAIYGGGLYYAQ